MVQFCVIFSSIPRKSCGEDLIMRNPSKCRMEGYWNRFYDSSQPVWGRCSFLKVLMTHSRVCSPFHCLFLNWNVNVPSLDISVSGIWSLWLGSHPFAGCHEFQASNLFSVRSDSDESKKNSTTNVFFLYFTLLWWFLNSHPWLNINTLRTRPGG